MNIDLHIDGVKYQVDTWKFPTGETGVKLNLDNVKFNPHSVVVVNVTFKSNDDIINCLQVVNALIEMRVSPYQIIVDIPYLPYSRQDRVCHPGEAFSLKVILDVLATMKVLVRTKDVHSKVATELGEFLCNIPQFVCAISLPHFDYLIAPDKGAASKVTAHLQVRGYGTNVHVANKQRIGNKVIHTDFEYDTIQGTACVVDDMCDGGATFVSIAEMIRRTQPNVTELSLYVTHGMFTQGVDKLLKLYDNIYCHNFVNSKDLVQPEQVTLI